MLIVGIIQTVANAALLFIRKINQKHLESQGTRVNPKEFINLKEEIKKNKEFLLEGLEKLGTGLLTMIPIAGSIYNGYEWYKDKHVRYV